MTDNLTTHKIIIAGLDSAGKTSIYKKMIEGADLKEIEDLPPTKGIERRSQTIMGHNVVFWELGGQRAYRAQYFQNPQTFANCTLMIYVIDLQDNQRFEESLDYLVEILMVVKKVELTPKIFVLMHKFDPDRIDELRGNFLEASKIFREVKNIPSLNVTRFPTSIYSDNLDFAFKKIMEKVVPDYTDPMMGLFDDDNENAEKELAGKAEPMDDDEFQTKDDLKSELTKHFETVLNGIRVRAIEKKEDDEIEP